MDEIRCSMCGKPNSADSSVCQHCGARLTPLTPSNAGKFTGGLSWLDAFREETGGSGKKAQNPPTPSAPEPPPEELPVGLSLIPERTSRGGIEGSDQEIQYDEPESDEQQDSGVDVPDWLRNLKEEPSQKKKEEPVPHWTAALRSWTDDSKPDSEEDEIEEEEAATPDQPAKVTDWFNRILPSGEKPAPAQADDDFIDDRDQKVLMDDVDMSDWRDSSASLSSIRDSKAVRQDVPSWLEDDASAPSTDPTENLMEWLQNLDKQEGGSGKQKARYWMGEVDTGELAKQKQLDPRFAEKENPTLPVYDPFSGEETGTGPKSDHKATQFFSESELDENDKFNDRRTPVQTVYFDEQDENPSEEDLPPWMKKVPDVPPAKPSFAPKMTAALDEGDEEIPDWMKDQPEDKFTKPSLMTAALSGMDDEALGMDLPAEEVPPWMKEQLEDKPASPQFSPAMTAILDDTEEESSEKFESPDMESSDLPKKPILTVQLSGLDDEDLGMDLPAGEPAPWMKEAEEVKKSVSKPPSMFTAALRALEEIPSDEEKTPPWEMKPDEVENPIQKPPSIFTAALQAMEDIPSDEEETPFWMKKVEEAEKSVSKPPSMFTAALRALEEIPSEEEDTPLWEMNPEEVAPPLHQAPSMMTAALRILEEEPTEEDEIPPWMNELENIGLSSTTTSAQKPEPSGELKEEPAREEEIPSWMKNIEDVTAPLRPSASMMTAALSNLDEEEPAQDEEIPSWMKELEEAQSPVRPAAPMMTAALNSLDEEEPSQEDEPPPWMKELEETPTSTRPVASMMTAALSGLDEKEPAQDEEIPSWMKALEEAVPPARPSAPTMTAALRGMDDNDLGMSESDGDLPAWMKNLEEATAPPKSMMTAKVGEEEDFEDSRKEPIERDASTSQPLMTAYFDKEPEEVDSSVASSTEADFDEDEIFPAGLGLTKALEEDIPDWLTSFNEAIEPSSAPLEVWNGSSSSIDLLEQEDNLELGRQEEEIGNLLPESTVPDWLSEMKQGGESSQLEENSAFTFESDDLMPENLDTSHPFAGDDLPNWLSPEIWQANGKKAEDVTEEAHAEGVENIQWELEGLEKGELPTWLHQIKPGQPGKTKRRKPEPGEEDTQTEKIGPLAGLMGVLPARDMDMMYRKPPIYSDQIQLTERQSNRMQVLTRMIESEAKNQPLKVAVEKVPLNLMRILFAVLLVLIMLIPFSGFILMPGSLPFVASDPVVSFYNQVEQYPENSSVLLVMDFESGYSAEMRSSLDGLLDRLYEKRVNVAMISTLPIGPVLAEEIAQDIWLKHYAAHPETNVAEYESRVVNLGYLPGGSAAMLQFLRYPHQTVQYGFRYEKTPSSVWNSNVLSSIQSVDEFAGLIVLTDSPTLSRDWIEQSSLNTRNHMMMVTSAQAYPLILPYWQSGQIKGLIAGLYQGYTYRSLLNQSAGLAARWYSYQFGMNLVTLIVILLTLGTIVRNTFAGRKTPR